MEGNTSLTYDPSVTEISNMTFDLANGNGSFPGLIFVNPLQNNNTRVSFIVVYGLVFACCFLGNLVVLLVIIKNKRMRTRTNFFLANLAVADFAVGIFCILPNMLKFFTLEWILGIEMCRIYYFVEHTSYTASVLFLVVIAVERYVAIMQPLQTRQLFTTLRLQIAQVCIWVLACCYNIPVLYFFHMQENISQKGMVKKVFCLPPTSGDIMKIFVTTNFFVWYVLPLCVLVYVYTRIAYTLWVSSRNIQAHEGMLFSRNTESKQTCCNCACFKLSDRRGSETDEKYTCNTAYTNESSSSGNHGDTNRKASSRHAHDNGLCHTNTITNSMRHSPLSVRYCIPNNNVTTEFPRAGRTAQPEGSPDELASVMGSEAMYNENSSSFRSRITVRPPRQSNLSSHRAMDSRRHVIKLLMAVLATFAVFVLPNHMRLLFTYWGLFPTLFQTVFPPVSYVMLFINSALNPFLYWLFSGLFRQSFRDTFFCRRKDTNVGRYTVT